MLHLPRAAIHSAVRSARDRQRFLDAGMDDYLTKPIEEAELVRVLSRWLFHSAHMRSALPSVRADQLPVIAGVDVDVALNRVNGKRELLWRLLNDFRTRNADAAVRLRASFASGDFAAARDLAHTIKGAAATLAAQRIADNAAAIELAARAGTTPTSTLDEFQCALAELGSATIPSIETATPERSVRVVSGTALSDALQVLRAELAGNSLAADRACAAFMQQMNGGAAAEARELSEAIARLDYRAAERILARIEQQLTEHSA